MELPRHDARQVGGTGQPSVDEYRYRRNLDQNVRRLRTDVDGKADQATTLAGYGITDAEKLGVTRSGVVRTGNHTLGLTDAGRPQIMSVAGANTLTVPPASSVAFEAWTYVPFIQAGAGQTTITPGSGVTIVAYNSALKTAGQGAFGELIYQGSDVWYCGGNLVP